MSQSDNVIVERDEWDQLISSMERFITLHQQTLERLKELKQRNESLRRQIDDSKTRPRLDAQQIEKPNPKPSLRKRLFSSNALTVNRRSGRSTSIKGVLQCGRCGFRIVKPSGSCERCGVSFGGVYCVCGRPLGSNDKFCDNCGRTVSQ